MVNPFIASLDAKFASVAHNGATRGALLIGVCVVLALLLVGLAISAMRRMRRKVKAARAVQSLPQETFRMEPPGNVYLEVATLPRQAAGGQATFAPPVPQRNRGLPT